MSIADIGDGVQWWEAVDLLEQVASHPGAHYWSKLHGFDEPTSWGDVIGRLQAQAVLNMLRGKDHDPIKLPMPFSTDEVPVSPEERDELVAYARATVPFPLDD